MQRGLLRWFLALHSPTHPFGFEPEKLPKDDAEQAAAAAAKSASKGKGKPKATRGKKQAPSDDPVSAELEQKPAESGPVEGDGDDGDGAGPADAISAAEDERMRGSSPDVSSVPPAPAPSTPARRLKRKGDDGTDPAAALGLPALPTPFTASIERTLAGMADEEGDLPGASAAGAVKKGKKTPLPEGLTVAALKSRLEGKKKIK